MRRIMTAAAGLIALGACQDAPSAPAGAIAPTATVADRNDAKHTRCDADNGGITLPSGFCATVVADHVGQARHVSVSDRGDIYIAIGSPTAPGGVLALRDRDRDGHADVQETFGEPGANGIIVTGDYLYVAYESHIVRYRMHANDLVPREGPETLITGLPTGGDHFRKNIQLDGRGGLFVNIGSATNSCQVQNRVLHSPGIDPCPELPTRAGIWRFDANRTGQVQSDGERYAMGFRNSEALRYNTAQQQLYAAPHERDMLDENWPEFFTAQQGAELPTETFSKIDRGDNNGWPYCYNDHGTKRLNPEYGGNGTIIGPRCANTDVPLLSFPGHWAPNDLLFYTGSLFPSRYRAGAFIAFHGGHDRSPLPNEGFNVSFVPMNGMTAVGTFETFADGFTGGATNLPAEAQHRPMGLAEGPDGALFVTDDRGGRVWKIVYTR